MKIKYLLTPIDRHLAKKLKEFRISSGMSQDELGELTGVSMQQIQKYETAQNRIPSSRLFEFSQFFQKPIGAFFYGLKADRDYYNYEFEGQKALAKKDIIMTSQIKALVNSFSRIENPNSKKYLIALAGSIAKPKRKIVKHCYS